MRNFELAPMRLINQLRAFFHPKDRSVALAGECFIEMIELATDPAAPAVNQARLYVRDDGTGKTELCVRFNTGAVQVIATEP